MSPHAAAFGNGPALDVLQASDKIASVRYPALPGNEHYERARKYLPLGCSGVMSIDIKGGRAPAMKFMDSLKLACNEVHVADIRTCVLHPASETHRQLTDEQLVAAGIEPGLVRLSVGLENVEDIIADLDQALAQTDIEASYEYWKRAQWDGTEGIAPQGAATWCWIANVDHLYFKRMGLDVADQKPHPHGHGWSLVNNVDRWSWSWSKA